MEDHKEVLNRRDGHLWGTRTDTWLSLALWRSRNRRMGVHSPVNRELATVSLCLSLEQFEIYYADCGKQSWEIVWGYSVMSSDFNIKTLRADCAYDLLDQSQRQSHNTIKIKMPWLMTSDRDWLCLHPAEGLVFSKLFSPLLSPEAQGESLGSWIFSKTSGSHLTFAALRSQPVPDEQGKAGGQLHT